MVKTLVDDFDRLLSEDNFREIFDRRFEFVPVVKDDTSRKDAIEQIVRNITRIDGTISLAEVSSKNGNNFAAWEALAELRDEFPKDPELLQRLEKLSSKVADFTVALNRAKEFEDNDLNPQTGSALSWYMQAKSIYPSSEHAQEGIDRLSKRIMPDELGQEPAESSSESPFDEGHARQMMAIRSASLSLATPCHRPAVYLRHPQYFFELFSCHPIALRHVHFRYG